MKTGEMMMTRFVFVTRRVNKASSTGTRADEKKANGGRRDDTNPMITHTRPLSVGGFTRLKSAVAGQFNYIIQSRAPSLHGFFLTVCFFYILRCLIIIGGHLVVYNRILFR